MFFSGWLTGGQVLDLKIAHCHICPPIVQNKSHGQAHQWDVGNILCPLLYTARSHDKREWGTEYESLTASSHNYKNKIVLT